MSNHQAGVSSTLDEHVIFRWEKVGGTPQAHQPSSSYTERQASVRLRPDPRRDRVGRVRLPARECRRAASMRCIDRAATQQLMTCRLLTMSHMWYGFNILQRLGVS